MFQTLFESPDFKPYNWYTIGLGSFHAFHAGGTLAAVVFNPKCYSEYEEIKNLLDRSLRMFASLSIHSALCAKAVPILQQIVYVLTSTHTFKYITMSLDTNIDQGNRLNDLPSAETTSYSAQNLQIQS
jgi:hypothetical protein